MKALIKFFKELFTEESDSRYFEGYPSPVGDMVAIEIDINDYRVNATDLIKGSVVGIGPSAKTARFELTLGNAVIFPTNNGTWIKFNNKSILILPIWKITDNIKGEKKDLYLSNKIRKDSELAKYECGRIMSDSEAYDMFEKGIGAKDE